MSAKMEMELFLLERDIKDLQLSLAESHDEIQNDIKRILINLKHLQAKNRSEG